MFCPKCGKQIYSGEQFCSGCGTACSGATSGAVGHPNNQVHPDDKRSFWWGVLGAFLGWISIILFVIFRDKHPLRAKSILIGFFVGIALYVVFVIVISVLLVLLGVFLFDPLEGKAKEFSKDGITITATEDFKMGDVAGWNITLEHDLAAIQGMREGSPSPLLSDPLKNYSQIVATRNNVETDSIKHYTKDDVEFYYFTYEEKLSTGDFKRLGITLMSDSNYYFVLFSCRQDNFSKFESTFMKWAKLVVVENKVVSHGMTISVPSKYKTGKHDDWDIYIKNETYSIEITAKREVFPDYSGNTDYSLRNYTNTILARHYGATLGTGYTGVLNFKNDETNFDYFVQSMEDGREHIVAAFKGESNLFYDIRFSCAEDDFHKYHQLLFNFAKLVKVE